MMKSTSVDVAVSSTIVIQFLSHTIRQKSGMVDSIGCCVMMNSSFLL